MKNKMTLAAAIMIGLLSAVGCSAQPSNHSSNTSEQAQHQAQDSKEFVKTYYMSLLKDKSEDSFTSITNLEKTISSVLDEEKAKKLMNSESISEEINKLSDDEAKKLSEKMIEINPLSEYIDYSNIDDKEKIYFSSLIMSISSMGSVYEDSESNLKVELSDDFKPLEKNDSVEIDNSQILLINGESELELNNSLGTDKTFLVKKDTGWKIDAKKTLESLMKAVEGIQGEVPEE